METLITSILRLAPRGVLTTTAKPALAKFPGLKYADRDNYAGKSKMVYSLG
jgi:hypothetical protein